MLDRRGFLRNTAGGAAALALAGMISPGCAAEYPDAVTDGVTLRTLTPKQYAVVRAAAEALLVGLPVSAAAVAASVDRELALVGDPVAGDMKAVLGLVEHLTILGGRLRRFTALSPEARLRYLGTWRESRFKLRRAAYMALRAVVYYTAYAEDSTRPVTGFEGPWTERYTIPVYPVDFGEVV